MENKYFKKLASLKKIGTRPIIGISKQEITNVENRLKIKLPKAYIEFLIIAGDDCSRIQLLENPHFSFVSAPETIQRIHDQMDRDNYVIERPFWAFTTADGVECFWFFYLDEDVDDPVVYRYEDPAGDGQIQCGPIGDTPDINPIKTMTFSELINSQLEYALLEQKRGY
jgi:hypothetical protein